MIKRFIFTAVIAVAGFLINSSINYGQFSSSDYSLVKTTYTKEFNKDILSEYIASQSPRKIIAALLSISQGSNYSLLSFAMNAEFDKYGDYVCFALGEFGPNEKSIRFLKEKIFSADNPFTRETFEAFGSIADRDEFEKVIQSYNQLNETQKIGISLAIANYGRRGYKVDDDKFTTVLSHELENKDPRRRFDALYAIYRSGGNEKLFPQIINLFNSEKPSDYYIMNIVYALSCLRTKDFCPDDFSIAQKYLTHSSWNIRCEAVRVAANYNFASIKKLSVYIALLKDKNQNVARQAAVSLKQIKLNSIIQEYIRETLEKYIADATISFNVKGELFVSFCSLFPTDTYELINKYSYNLGTEFIYRVLENNIDKPDFNFRYLCNKMPGASNTDLMNLFPALLVLQENLYSNGEFSDKIISALQSNFPPVVSLIADGIDSTFCERYSAQLRNVVDKQVTENINDPDFVDALPSLERLAEKISGSFGKKICSIMLSSRTYSVASYASAKLDRKETIEKSLDNFDQLWEYAFKFSQAVIRTNKGNFTIEFKPEFAPISAGNFCKLASENFFNNTLFHRVVPNFVIQSGDPTGTGWGGPGYEIVSEFSPIPFSTGHIGMASSGKDTEGSQWFVMTADYPHLNGRYSNFGKVVDGMNIVNNIDQYDKVLSIKLIK